MLLVCLCTCSRSDGPATPDASAEVERDGATAEVDAAPPDTDGAAEPRLDAAIPEPLDPATAWHEMPLYKSGSRLRARVHDASGGALQFRTFHDSELGVDCSFDLSEDGEWGCLPGGRDGEIYYLDAGCTQAVVRTEWTWEPDGCAADAPTFMTLEGEPDPMCGFGTSRIYRLGPELPPMQVYQDDGEGGCEAVDVTQRCLHEFELAIDVTFVRGERRSRPGDHGLAIDFIAYDDGAELVAGARDVARDARCGPHYPTAIHDRCVPAAQAYWFEDPVTFSSLFADADCTGATVLQVATALRKACGEERTEITERWSPNECGGYGQGLYTLGREVPYAYSPTGSGGCERIEPETSYAFHALGEPFDASTLPPIRALRGGASRLTVNYYATEDGRPFQIDPGSTFHDADLARDCTAVESQDGMLRCVPLGSIARTSIAGPFVDPACTTLLAAFEPPGPRPICSPEPPTDLVYFGTDNVYRVGRATAPPQDVVFYLDAGNCMGWPLDPTYAYFEIGEAIPLASVEERVE